MSFIDKILGKSDLPQKDKAEVKNIASQTYSLKVANEFEAFLKCVHKVSVDPLLSKEQRRILLSENVDNLSSGTFTCYFVKILEIVQKKKEYCEPYKDSEEQVKAIIHMIPRLGENANLVLEVIKERRKKYGLRV